MKTFSRSQQKAHGLKSFYVDPGRGGRGGGTNFALIFFLNYGVLDMTFQPNSVYILYNFVSDDLLFCREVRYCRTMLPYIPKLGGAQYISPVQSEHQHQDF